MSFGKATVVKPEARINAHLKAQDTLIFIFVKKKKTNVVAKLIFTNIGESQADHGDIHWLLKVVLQSKNYNQYQVADHCCHINDEEEPRHYVKILVLETRKAHNKKL